MAVNETSDVAELETSTSNSSLDSESSKGEKGLLCLFSREEDENSWCLMAKDDEVNSQSSSSTQIESSSGSEESVEFGRWMFSTESSMDSVVKLMRDFQVVKNTYSKLKEENSQLMISYDELRRVRIKNIELAIANDQLEKKVHLLKEECTERELREQNLREVIASFTNSSKMIDRMVNASRPPREKAGIGYNPSSSSHILLNKPMDSSSSGGLKSMFVQGPTQMPEPMNHIDKGKVPQIASHSKGKAVQCVVEPTNGNLSKGNPRHVNNVKRNGSKVNRPSLHYKKGQPTRNNRLKVNLNAKQRQVRSVNQRRGYSHGNQKNERNGYAKPERSLRKPMKGDGRSGPSEEDWLVFPEPLSKAKFEKIHRHKQINYSKDNRVIWYIDSGCSRHMTGDKSNLSNFKEVDGTKVIFGGESGGKTKGVGDIIKNEIIIREVSYVEGLKFNFLSTSQFCDKGYKVEFSKDKCNVISTENGDIILSTSRKKNMYVVSWKLSKANVCLMAKSNADLSWEWYSKLNHLNLKTIRKLAKGNLVEGLPKVSYIKDKICDAC
ncbi:PREDICTED: uncharacterized protein LOC109188716 [Ipomoea nil]|uniref:uncharacterized protein LOC109188716 n=1 Tax=Ipomoea nil TaxID=35883 RepID=UPI0009011536|nr:PREDICTED: uncharacterized protein LOC109188716 [Ipomoea nil]